jgi:hypothetical protein
MEASANPFGLTDAELLDALGPSWHEMTPLERRLYPSKPTYTPERPRNRLAGGRSRSARGFLSLERSA